MQEGSVPGYEDRVPIFPGGSCFPLSGEGDSATSNERLDQLSVILGVIGTPSPEDVASIGNANEYIKTLKKSPSKNIESLYPAATADAIDLLKIMLQFNPKKRCTAEEALEHNFFKDMRQEHLEVSGVDDTLCPIMVSCCNCNSPQINTISYHFFFPFPENCRTTAGRPRVYELR